MVQEGWQTFQVRVGCPHNFVEGSSWCRTEAELGGIGVQFSPCHHIPALNSKETENSKSKLGLLSHLESIFVKVGG